MEDKLNYRYPGVGGESYADLVMRVQEREPRPKGVLEAC